MCIPTVNLNKRFKVYILPHFLFGEEEHVTNHAPGGFQEKYVFNKGALLLFGENTLIILSSHAL